VLLALARGRAAANQEELERTAGLKLDPGSLYRLIARLVDEA
jgi:hypothetical protein